MGVVVIFLVSLSWSFVGIFVKVASLMVDSGTITFLRFFIGVIILAIVYRVKKGPIHIRSKNRWIWVGSIGKSLNYLLENIGIVLGLSYGYMVGFPISFLLLLLISVFILKESMVSKDWLGALLSMGGVWMIMLNGRSMSEMIAENGVANLLFVLAGIGVALHMFSQKKLIPLIDPLTMNLSIFSWCALITAIPLPLTFEFKGFHLGALLALIALGAITGLSFYWFAQALRTVPLFLASVISNSNILFTVLWGVLFFGEPVGLHVLAGALLFSIGMIVVNWPKSKQVRDV